MWGLDLGVGVTLVPDRADRGLGVRAPRAKVPGLMVRQAGARMGVSRLWSGRDQLVKWLL